MGVRTKKYFYKVYEPDGTFITTLNDVSNAQPEFSMDINGGVGYLTLAIARSWKTFYANRDLQLYNEVKIIVNDYESNAQQIYSGYINKIRLQKDKGGHEQVTIEVAGYVAELPFRLLQFSTGETALQYDADTIEDIFRDIIDKYNGKLDYSGTSITATGLTATETFNLNTIKESLDRMISRLPAGWYWYATGENVIYLDRTNKEEPDHTLIIGRHINQIDMAQSMENVMNDVVILGATPDGSDQLMKRYQNANSVEEFGRRTEIKNDGRLYVEDSVDKMATYLLGTNYSKEIEVEFDILDSNIDGVKGYDIESLRPGQVIRIKDPRHNSDTDMWDQVDWDEGYWDFDKNEFINEPIIIESIKYYGTGCRIRASKSVPGLGFRMEDIKKDIDNLLASQVPVIPSNVDVAGEEEGELIRFAYDANGDLIRLT